MELGSERNGIEVGEHQDQGIDPAAEGSQHGLDFLAIAVGARNQQVETGAARGEVETTQQLGIKLAV